MEAADVAALAPLAALGMAVLAAVVPDAKINAKKESNMQLFQNALLARRGTAQLAAASALGVALLASCGGDNGYGCGYDAYGNPLSCTVSVAVPVIGPVASTLSFAPAQTLLNVATLPYSFTVSSSDALGNAYTISNVSAPGPASSFNGGAASTTILTQNFFTNGVAGNADTTTSYFDPHTAAFLGASGLFPGEFEVVTTFQAPPTVATVGQSFPLLSANLYHDSTQTVLDGSLTETLGIQADTATTALVCLEDSVQLTASGIADGLSSLPTSTCYRVDTSGTLLGLQISTDVNGNLLTFQ